MTQITKSNAYALFEDDVIEDIIQGVVQESAVLKMFTRLPNMTSSQLKMTILDKLPIAYWVNNKVNNGRKGLTNMMWDNKFIVAEELAVIVPIKEALLDDASIDIWAQVRPRIIEAFGKKIDQAVFTGVDKPSGFRADLLTSIINASASISNTGDLYSDISDAMGYVEESGFNPTGLIGGLNLKAKFRKMVDGNNLPITGTEINELTKAYVTNGAWDKNKALLMVGDFSQAVYSIRQDVTYKLLTEGIIQDPVSGAILYNLGQDDMVALRVVMRLGWEIPNPINAEAENEETRFPFAVVSGTQTPTTYTATFTITDSSSNAVSDVKVSVAGISKKTNASGVATFALKNGTYDYVAKKGDAKANGSVTINSGTASVTIANF